MTTLAPTRPIILSHDHGSVTVVPADQDRFVVASDAAVTALRQENEQTATRDRFRETVLLPLREWCEDRVGRVLACYVQLFPTADHVRVFVFNTSQSYDLQLAREVAALEHRLFDNGWRVVIRQLIAGDRPDEYFDGSQAIQVYMHPMQQADHADGGPAPREGRTQPTVPRGR